MNDIELLTEVLIGDLTVKVFREPGISEEDARSVLDHFMEKLSNGQIVNKKGEPVKPNMHFITIHKDHTLLCGRKSDDQPYRLMHVVLKDVKLESANDPTHTIGDYDGLQLKVPMKIVAL